jgi:hypothetical protein
MEEPPLFTRKERYWLWFVVICGAIFSLGLGFVLGSGGVFIGVGLVGLVFAFCEPRRD